MWLFDISDWLRNSCMLTASVFNSTVYLLLVKLEACFFTQHSLDIETNTWLIPCLINTNNVLSCF